MEQKTILVDAQVALGAVQQIMGLLRAITPVAAMAGPIGLAVTGASEILIPLISRLVEAGVMTIGEQAQLQEEVKVILSGEEFTGPQWQPRPESPDAPAPEPPAAA